MSTIGTALDQQFVAADAMNEQSLPVTREAELLFVYLRKAAKLESSDRTALYQRLHEALRSAIRDDVIGPGSAIPGERELAERLSLSRVTIRKAIKSLVDERLLVQRQGARTSVARRVEKPVSVFTSFSQDMIARGFKAGAIWLDREVRVALPGEAMALGLSPGAQVCRLKRLRTANEIPMALEESIVPTAFLPSPDLVRASLYEVLEELGHRPMRALQRMRSIVASREQARALKVKTGAPLLEFERRCFLESGRTVEYCRSLYRGDAYDFLIELQR
jgi:GntR family transcriptional regulator